MSNARHGLSKTYLYAMWVSLVQRCNNPNDSGYYKYGAKGVTVCDEWLDPYKFMGWALLNGYREGLTIDRVNVYGNYEPSNCTWIPGENQHINKRLRECNTSGYAGVSFHKGKGVWIARVNRNGKRREVGKASTAKEANDLRLIYLKEHGMTAEIKAYELQQANR